MGCKHMLCRDGVRGMGCRDGVQVWGICKEWGAGIGVFYENGVQMWCVLCRHGVHVWGVYADVP